MALLILPIGLVLGYTLGNARRAAITTVVIGAAALLAYLISGTQGVEVSPLEIVILVVCLPAAMWLAKWGAARRRR